MRERERENTTQEQAQSGGENDANAKQEQCVRCNCVVNVICGILDDIQINTDEESN